MLPVIDLISSDEEAEEALDRQTDDFIPTITALNKNNDFSYNENVEHNVMNLYSENTRESEGTQLSHMISSSQIEIRRSKKVSSRIPNNKLIGVAIDERLQQNSILTTAISEEFLLQSVSSGLSTTDNNSDNTTIAIQEKYYFIFAKSAVPNLIRWVYEPFLEVFPSGKVSNGCRVAQVAVVYISDCVSFVSLLLSSSDGVDFTALESYVNIMVESLKRQDSCPEECRLVLTFNQTDLNKAIHAAQRKVILTYIHTYIHTHTCIHTYIHT